MPFKKGQSGNPAGRKPGYHNPENMRLKAEEKKIRVKFADWLAEGLDDINGDNPFVALIKIYQDPKVAMSHRMKALDLLLPYVYTKVSNNININAGESDDLHATLSISWSQPQPKEEKILEGTVIEIKDDKDGD